MIRGPQNTCVWQTWQAYYSCVLWWSFLELMFLVFYKKTCLKEGEDRRKSFSNKIIVTLVTQGLLSSSPVLLRKPTTAQWMMQLNSDLFDCVTCFYGFSHSILATRVSSLDLRNVYSFFFYPFWEGSGQWRRYSFGSCPHWLSECTNQARGPK